MFLIMDFGDMKSEDLTLKFHYLILIKKSCFMFHVSQYVKIGKNSCSFIFGSSSKHFYLIASRELW